MIEAAVFGDNRYPYFVLRQLLDVDSSHCVVAIEPGADDDSAVIGYALTMRGNRHAWLASIAVSPDRRGRGHGRNLLQRTVDSCLEASDADEVLLAVDPGNLPAYNLFTSFGFVLLEHHDQYFGGSSRRSAGTGADEPRDVLSYSLHRPATQF
ncbi:GNAT family N-acetyltransferase [Nocardia sp. NPDC051832]|uniref:GNAT family N-acetyltransferase n=1 Tax=Nocardia sp. NPDC051832 TaxID=3155673 RepID=UPI003421D77B